MKIIFLTDYRGVLTNERYYLKGDSADMPDAFASALVKANRATFEEVAQPAPVVDYSAMSYRQLQRIAKDRGIAANQSKSELVEALQ